MDGCASCQCVAETAKASRGLSSSLTIFFKCRSSIFMTFHDKIADSEYLPPDKLDGSLFWLVIKCTSSSFAITTMTGPSASGYTPPPRGGVNVGGGSSVGRAIFALVGGFGGAYLGFYLQSKYIEERRVRVLVEIEAQKRWEEEKAAAAASGTCE